MTTESIRRDNTAFNAPADLKRLQTLGLVAGGLGLVACLIGFFLSREYFFRAWLLGWVFWMGVTLGCLALMMLHHLTHGSWGLVLRRVMEAASRTLPLLALLFLPILLLGMPYLYEWSHPDVVKADPILQAKAPYLNVTAFVIRQIVYFAIWGGFAFLLNRMSRRQDEGRDEGITRRMQAWAAPGLILYCLSVSFASVDWLMSLQPHWFSTIYGVYLIGSQGLAALSFLILTALFLSRRQPMSGVYQPRHFHDWGKLLFAFVMLWAYFSWSQFLITWAGNLPEEISFYLGRIRGAWGWIALLIVLFHFAVPFAVLLSRDLKRHAPRLAVVAVLMLFMRWVDLVWQIEPAFHERHAAFYWMYAAAPVAIGGFWLMWFARQLQQRPLLPLHDPYLPEAIAHEHHH